MYIAEHYNGIVLLKIEVDDIHENLIEVVAYIVSHNEKRKFWSIQLYLARKNFYSVRQHLFHKSWKNDNFPTIAELAALSIEKVEKTALRDARGIEIDDMMHELIVITMHACSWTSQKT